ncbi:hypothetical protein MATR_18560 [Marivirga tractuosa]|uniref:Uncharacterized protein n=1 Tax=Marivirga tractuosa (strain ATCC 23168 / DSM 4126 / NBRC 15989 / NCIMB 1408 / VKM B-1430 / H-43) TaxID=643867 RepID=E4TPW4_MARTH|nr:hypothetical protein Ftrac_0517 [Marivirga tractuosa DSM 4126]BDD15031.1 hypothetical protein MATR_18560 [Marivirga tractuosa]
MIYKTNSKMQLELLNIFSDHNNIISKLVGFTFQENIIIFIFE